MMGPVLIDPRTVLLLQKSQRVKLRQKKTRNCVYYNGSSSEDPYSQYCLLGHNGGTAGSEQDAGGQPAGTRPQDSNRGKTQGA